MGACCSTDEDKGNINIDRKGGENKRKADVGRGGKLSTQSLLKCISGI